MPDSRSRIGSVQTKDGKFLKEMRWQKVDEEWVLRHFGRPILTALERDGKYEDEEKEICILKIEREEKVEKKNS